MPTIHLDTKFLNFAILVHYFTFAKADKFMFKGFDTKMIDETVVFNIPQ